VVVVVVEPPRSVVATNVLLEEGEEDPAACVPTVESKRATRTLDAGDFILKKQVCCWKLSV
jgi:hypothetical protein